MARFLTETKKFHDFLVLWLVAIDPANAAQHPGTGSTLPPEATRMADVLMSALIVE